MIVAYVRNLYESTIITNLRVILVESVPSAS